MKQRPETLFGTTVKTQTGVGNVYVTVNYLGGKPFEVFVSTGKCGQSTMAKAEAVGRLVSLALRNDIGVEEIIKQLSGIAGSHPLAHGDGIVLSIPDAVAKVLVMLERRECSESEQKEA
jgi:ribonucleoside-diphosphate reductase alpha chain